MPKRLAIFGSTGSIGTSTLDVVRRLAGRFEVAALVANRRVDELAAQAKEFKPRRVAVTDPECAAALRARMNGSVEVLCGEQAQIDIASSPDIDIVVSAIVGAAGLPGVLAAVEAGKTVALANKEPLVMAGPLMMAAAKKSGARIVPVDSEHSAIFQSMQSGRASEVRRLVLTASGGPFRGRPSLEGVTVAEALNHPTWDMGPKITIDSATLMNKALEIVEARWLFGVPAERIDVVIHPQSAIHSMVEFIDGSVVAQLGLPDMRLPIQYALTYPERVDGDLPRLDLLDMGKLEFFPPDRKKFPSLDYGYRAAREGGTLGAALNAANEEGVRMFLDGRIGLIDILRGVGAVMDAHVNVKDPDLAAVLAADRWAREEMRRRHG
jgi:1-deoxy-D-xylulose-5-phosphate reductoisomerase